MFSLPPVVFSDTSYAVALTNARDADHRRALAVGNAMHKAGTRMITHRGVLLEIGNQFGKQSWRADGVRLLSALEADHRVEIVDVTPTLYAAGFALFAARPDKDWGLVDCVSFALMADRGLTDALTADDHFTQAGFTALLV